MNITLRQIEVFVATARSGNLTRAASRLHMTPSAASAALKEFEHAIGERLFTRTAGGLSANESGRALLARAETALAAVADLEDAAPDTGQMSGRITLACSPTINSMMPDLIRAFCDLNPQIEIDVRVYHTPDAVAAVASRAAQIGLVGLRVPPGIVSVEPWLLDETVVVTSAESSLPKLGHVSTDQLAGQTWITGESQPDLLREFDRVGLVAGSVRLMGLPDAVKAAVVAGLGLGCLSRTLIERELASGALVELDTDLRMTRQFSIITPLRKSPDALTGFVLEWLRAMQP